MQLQCNPFRVTHESTNIKQSTIACTIIRLKKGKKKTIEGFDCSVGYTMLIHKHLIIYIRETNSSCKCTTAIFFLQKERGFFRFQIENSRKNAEVIVSVQ